MQKIAATCLVIVLIVGIGCAASSVTPTTPAMTLADVCPEHIRLEAGTTDKFIQYEDLSLRDPPEFDPVAAGLMAHLVDAIILANDDIAVCREVVARHKAKTAAE